MQNTIWMSSLLGNYDIGMKQGTRTKFYGCNWNPASLDIPLEPDEIYAASRKHMTGFALERSDFPEAVAVFDEKRFARCKDVFTAGPFYAVKGALADTLRRFDLGDGGLLPLTVYQSDLSTPLTGEFFILNFGARKHGFLPEKSGDARKFLVDRETGVQVWDVNALKPDAEVALSSTALNGADLWFDPAVYNKFFLSDQLAQALIALGMADVFKLKACKVLEQA